jgi:uncharacterized membrane protein
MSFVTGLYKGAAVAGAVWFLDPRSGRRRRAIVRDKVRHAVRQARATLLRASTDLDRRVHGGVAQMRARGETDDASDEVVCERVRARLGHVCARPGEIGVRCLLGAVTLRGRIGREEHGRALAAVRRVRGVKSVASELEESGGVGRGIQARGWSPAARLVLGSLGGALFLGGVTLRPRPASVVAAALGAGLLVRGVTNLNVRRLTGLGAGRRAITVTKTIHVDAPVEEVWALWTSPETFPRFMSHVRDVARTPDGTWRWTVDGPAGVPVTWEAVVTRAVPNEILAWESRETSAIQSEGRVRFVPRGLSRTTLEVRMIYNPLAGAIGHEVARLFGRDPKKQMDDDLLRLKSLLESGRTTGHARVTRDNVTP